MVLAVGFTVFMFSQEESPEVNRPGVVAPSAPTPSSNKEQVPPFHADANEAKPFPETLSPSLFPNPVVARAYRIAEEMPEVLAQQPCYCYCDGFGHGSLLDCYSDGHGAG